MDPAKLKVVELRAALAERGLDTKGNKPVLVERLRKALEEDIQEHIQERSDEDMEDIGDTALKEASEKFPEATRASQPPRTPSRSSRSSTVVTPTKVSTRNASRTATTPNSSKQSSPSKFQYVEKAREALMTISESTSEEFVVQQEEISKLSSEKYREEQEDNASNIVQNETHVLSPEKSQEEEAKHINILEDDRYEANVSQVPATESSEKSSTIENVDQSPRMWEKHEANEPSVDEVRKLQQSVVRATFIDETKDITKLEEKTDVKEDINIYKVKDDKISIERKNIDYIEDSYNIKDKIDIPKIEQPTHVISDQIDRACDIELQDKGKTIDDDYTMQKEKMDVSVNIENANEKADNIDAPQYEQITEMKSDDAKLEADELNKECKDRKRKRSPSLGEDQRKQESPILLKPENEPDFDNSAVILSWYDSDLNLIIDKEGFFSATPMHDDNFCHIWAGARASYGFVNGKVYYEAKITERCYVATEDEEQLHMLRVGWSIPSASMQLGEGKFSYAYTSAGKRGTDKEFTDFGLQFTKDDVIGCYLDMTLENTVELSYTMNGKDLGPAFTISKEELGDKPLFPHILSKNCTFVCNFGQEDAWCEQIPEYTLAGHVELKDRIIGPRRPDGKEECEVIMVCGLPGAGKTTWAKKHAVEHPDKLYNILGSESLIEKTGCQEQDQSRRQVIIIKCHHALDGLVNIASGRRRNYILDQRSNVNYWTQKHKMRIFNGYQRKAVIVIPTDEEYNQHLSTYDLTKNSSDFNMELKPNFNVPSVGELFDTVEWIGLDEEEGKKLIDKYNNERVKVSQQQPVKRPRLDKTESNRETRDSRNNRDTRDHRDRRNNYQDRGRNPPWRGNMGGWRGERPQRGGYMRHSGGYGPPVPWRLRGRGGPTLRGIDRRGGLDRRSGNDRNRPVAARQGGWGPMSSNYQGSQQSGWGQQDNWSSGQTQGSWGQQGGGWGQQGWGGSWKGYGQGTYSQTGYSQQQGYGNGNWNNWNQQYYNNQYWGQQQQSGQTTAAGSQAEIASETTSTDIGAEYDYSQEW